jgi:hypothetical protein
MNYTIDELLLSCKNQPEYVKKLILFFKNNSNDYEQIELKFMNEIKRKYDHIINVLLKIINPNILIKIIKIKDNEEKIINYFLKFKNCKTIELFLNIIALNGKKKFVEQLMDKKYTFESEFSHGFPFHMSFLNIILFNTRNWEGQNKIINQKCIVDIFKKIKNLNQYMVMNEYRHYFTNYMTFVCYFNFENFKKIFNILINSTNGKNIFELLKIKIYYDKSSIETKLNLFEYLIVSFKDSHRYSLAIKLIEFIIDKLNNNYVNFILNECNLNLIIANSLQSEYWNNNEILNLIWRDDFLKYIEPSEIVKVSYWKTSILYESLCNKNLKFIEKILLNEHSSKKIIFDVKYKHFPEYSGEHTFISLLTFYIDFSNCAKIKNNLINIFNICFNNFKSSINFNNFNIISCVVKNNFNNFYKLNKIIIHDNLNNFNSKLIELEKIDEFKKIEQTNWSITNCLDCKFYDLCEKNNNEFIKCIIDKYFELNSIEDINKNNLILDSFNFVCENNYFELIELLFDKFIKSHLDFLVSLNYDNFKSKQKSKKLNNYYLDEVVHYCSKNGNFHIIEKLFDLKCEFNYFSFVDNYNTFLLELINYNFPNKFIIKVINELGEDCFPQHLNKKYNHTALTLSSIKNNIEVFDTLINKFGKNIHPCV